MIIVHVEVDFGLCESNAVCVGLVPDVFHLDEDDKLHILRSEVADGTEAELDEAVRQCPRQAIALID
jgi:ferredoxin